MRCSTVSLFIGGHGREKPYIIRLLFLRIVNVSIRADDMAEKLQSEVELHDVDLGALQLLVEYSYTGQVHITDENVQVIYLPIVKIII